MNITYKGVTKDLKYYKGLKWNKPLTPKMKEFQKETGKNPVYRRVITGTFEYWMYWDKKRKTKTKTKVKTKVKTKANTTNKLKAEINTINKAIKQLDKASKKHGKLLPAQKKRLNELKQLKKKKLEEIEKIKRKRKQSSSENLRKIRREQSKKEKETERNRLLKEIEKMPDLPITKLQDKITWETNTLETYKRTGGSLLHRIPAQEHLIKLLKLQLELKGVSFEKKEDIQDLITELNKKESLRSKFKAVGNIEKVKQTEKEIEKIKNTIRKTEKHKKTFPAKEYKLDNTDNIEAASEDLVELYTNKLGMNKRFYILPYNTGMPVNLEHGNPSFVVIKGNEIQIVTDMYKYIYNKNHKDANDLLKFTIGHELGHPFNRKKGMIAHKSEDLANKVAAELTGTSLRRHHNIQRKYARELDKNVFYKIPLFRFSKQ